jgi:hypothetical protein
MVVTPPFRDGLLFHLHWLGVAANSIPLSALRRLMKDLAIAQGER